MRLTTFKHTAFLCLFSLAAVSTSALAQITTSPTNYDLIVYSVTSDTTHIFRVTNSSSSQIDVFVGASNVFPEGGGYYSIPAGGTAEVELTLRSDQFTQSGIYESDIAVIDDQNNILVTVPYRVDYRHLDCAHFSDWRISSYPLLFNDSVRLLYYYWRNCTSDTLYLTGAAPDNMPWLSTIAAGDLAPYSVDYIPSFLDTTTPSEGFFRGNIELSVDDGMTTTDLAIPVVVDLDGQTHTVTPAEQTVTITEGQDELLLNFTLQQDSPTNKNISTRGDLVPPVTYVPGYWSSYDIKVLVDTSTLTHGRTDTQVEFIIDEGAVTLTADLSIIVVNPNNYEACLSQSAVVMDIQEGTYPGAYHVQLTNCGSAPFDYTVNAGHISWLSDVSPTSGNLGHLASETLVLRPSSNLTAGTYTDTITIDYGPNLQVSLPVIANVTTTTTPPQMAISQTSASATTPKGVVPAGTYINLANVGGGTMDFTISESLSWLNVTPSVGSLGAGNDVDLAFSYDVRNLNAGFYSGTVNVTTDGGNASVYVTLTVTNPVGLPVLTTKPTAISVTGVVGEAIPYQELKVVNTGGEGTFSLSHNISWINFPGVGSYTIGADDSINFQVLFVTAGLSAGTYSGNIIMQTLTEQSQIPVTMTLVDPYEVPTTSTNTIELTLQRNSGVHTETVQLSNSGAGWSMPYTAYDRPARNNGFPASFGNVSWLSVSPSSGTVFGNPANLTVSIDTNQMFTGTRTGFVVIDTANNKALVTVTVTITQGSEAEK